MEIKGDHLIPIVYNHRLFLFWFEFKLSVENSDDFSSQSDEIVKKWDVNLSWSENKSGIWSARHMISKPVELLQKDNPFYEEPHLFDKQDYCFSAWVEGSDDDSKDSKVWVPRGAHCCAP